MNEKICVEGSGNGAGSDEAKTSAFLAQADLWQVPGLVRAGKALSTEQPAVLTGWRAMPWLLLLGFVAPR